MSELTSVSLDVLLEHSPPSASKLIKMYKEVVNRYGKIGKMIVVLVKHGLTLLDPKWRALLNSGIQKSDIDLVRVSLDNMDSNTNQAINQAINLAVRTVVRSSPYKCWCCY